MKANCRTWRTQLLSSAAHFGQYCIIYPLNTTWMQEAFCKRPAHTQSNKIFHSSNRQINMPNRNQYLASFELLMQSEAKYKALSKELELILDHLPALVFYKDTNNKFIRVNKYVADAYGKNKKELEGVSLYEIYPPDIAEKYHQDDMEVITSREPKLNIEEPWETADGLHWVNTSKIPFIDNYGKIIGIIGISLDITERKRADLLVQELLHRLEQEKDFAQKISLTDGLTGIANRRHFDETFMREYSRSQRSGSQLSLILADIDYFKRFNDKYGHSAGDECLRMVACSLQNTVGRAPDLVARYGGEEFAIILPDTSRHGAAIIAERLRKAVSNLKIPHEFSDIASYVTISLGVTTTPHKNSVFPEKILKQADIALYQAKSAGRNRFVSAKNDEFITTSDPHANFLQLVWNANDECGNATIDAEHKYLFEIFNDLPGAIIGKPSKDDCAAILNAVMEEIRQHFYNEEVILEQAKYSSLEEHRTIHTQLYTDANQLIDKLKSNEARLVDVFNFLAFEVVFQHLFIEDKKYFPYI